MKLGIIGATGIVGQKLLEIIEERKLKFDIYTAASERSQGKKLKIKNKIYEIISIPELLRQSPHAVIFSAGSLVSKKWSPIFQQNAIFVIDNSSAWRMDDNTPLIIPEINHNVLEYKHKIIANPNCSTIQLVMAIKPLHDIYRIKRLIVSTYQAISGSGKNAVKAFLEQTKDINTRFDIKNYSSIPKNLYINENKIQKAPQQFYMNIIPQIGNFNEDGYTTEEIKIVNETRKILNDKDIKITATAVRVPIVNCHCESVNIEFYKRPNLNKIIEIYKKSKFLKSEDSYPIPIHANNNDFVYVGRVRKDLSNDKAINLWIVSDNIRKGAATNAIQILELLMDKYRFHFKRNKKVENIQ